MLLNAFLTEERLIVAASDSTSASTWFYGTGVSIPQRQLLAPVGSEVATIATEATSIGGAGMPVLTQKITSVDVTRPQRLSIAKTKRSKI